MKLSRALLIFAVVPGTVSLTSAAPDTTKALFCAYGGHGYTGSGLERQSAVAVVEIENTKKIQNVSLTEFALFDQSGKETKFSRIVNVEAFARPLVANERKFAYYMDSSGTRPWDGTLPKGKIQLRVRVALAETVAGVAVRFRLMIGTQIIEGTVNGRWGS